MITDDPSEEVLDFLRRRLGEKFTIRQLAQRLNVSKHNQKFLKAELLNLIHEGKVILDRDQHYTVRDQNKVLKGIIKLHSEGFGFFIPDSKKKFDVFIPQRFTNFAMNGDEILVESQRNQRDGRFEGKVIQVVNRANEVVVGTLRLLGQQHFVQFKDRKLGLPEIYIPKKNLGTAKVGDLVAVRILQYPGHRIAALGEIESVVGFENDEKSLIEAIFIQNNVRRKFPDAIARELGKLPDEVSAEISAGRVDLTHLPFMTIDGITAKDFDDAVFVAKKGRGYILYVSIADVAHYVTVESALDAEALARSTSTYLPDLCIPMLPEKLSNGLCSLNPNVPRYTMTAEIHYNLNFEFVRAELYPSLIRSRKRATYDEVEAYFDGTGQPDFTPELEESLIQMQVLAGALVAQAEARGAMGFDLPEPEMIFDSRGRVTQIKKRQRFFSHKLIEQFMIAANVVVAQFFSIHGLPLLYRVHEAPDHLKIQIFLALAHDLGFGRLIEKFHPADFFAEIADHHMENFLQTFFLRSLKQAIYSPENIGHFGLALEDYAHFTSPIRRYPDLVVHRQLKSLMSVTGGGSLKFTKADLQTPRDFGKEPHYSYGDLLKIGRHNSDREREAMEAERAVTDLKRCFFIKDHLAEKFYGVITRITKYGIHLELDPYFVEGLLGFKDMQDDYYFFDEKKIRLIGKRTKRIFKIGDRLWVQIQEVDVELRRISLRQYQEPSTGHSKKKRSGKRRRKGNQN